MKVTAKDLRERTKEIMGSVSRGEEVEITYHGKPVAVIKPTQKRKKTDKHTVFGMWADNSRSEDVDAYVRALRKKRNFGAD